MELKILGKYGPYGKPGEGAASGYLVRDEGFCMLLDMGSGVLGRLLTEASVKDLDGIFISHLHFDHTGDLLTFRYVLEETDDRVRIYTEKQDTEWYNVLFDDPHFEVINVDENTALEIKGKKITFYRMQHPSPDLAIRIEDKEGTFAYTGDTVYNDNLYNLLSGCDLAVVDCSKPAHFIGGHMPATVAKQLKAEIAVKKIIASHAAPDFNPSGEFEGVDGIEFAEEGKIYPIQRQ